jgi:hypothetical protein
VVAGVLGAMTGLLIFGWIGDSVHVTGAGSFRLPALLTFLPLLPLLHLMMRLPESSKMELISEVRGPRRGRGDRFHRRG